MNFEKRLFLFCSVPAVRTMKCILSVKVMNTHSSLLVASSVFWRLLWSPRSIPLYIMTKQCKHKECFGWCSWSTAVWSVSVRAELWKRELFKVIFRVSAVDLLYINCVYSIFTISIVQINFEITCPMLDDALIKKAAFEQTIKAYFVYFYIDNFKRSLCVNWYEL